MDPAVKPRDDTKAHGAWRMGHGAWSTRVMPPKREGDWYYPHIWL